MTRPVPPTPKWMTALIIVVLLPVFQFPVLLSNAPDIQTVRTLLWIYPFYCLTAAYLAYVCYPQRRVMSWILIALMILTHIAVWLLVTTPIEP